MATNTMFGGPVRAVYDGAGNLVGLSAGDQDIDIESTDATKAAILEQLKTLVTNYGGTLYVAGRNGYTDAAKSVPAGVGSAVYTQSPEIGTGDLVQVTAANRPVVASNGSLTYDENDFLLGTQTPGNAGFVSVVANLSTPAANYNALFGFGNGGSLAGINASVFKTTSKFTVAMSDGAGAAITADQIIANDKITAFGVAWRNGTQRLTVNSERDAFIKAGTVAKNVTGANALRLGRLGSSNFWMKGSLFSAVVLSDYPGDAVQDAISSLQLQFAGITQRLPLIIIGDSTSAAYSGSNAVASYLVANGEPYTNYKDVSDPSDTILQQQTAFLASGNSRGYAIVQIGLNDLDYTESAATALGRYQTLVNTLTATGVRVITATMSPCRARLITLYGGTNGPTAYTKWLDMNTAILGGGANAITGQYATISAHTTALNDGSGNLASIYDTGDGIHPNNAGRMIVAGAWSDAIAGIVL